MSGCASSPMEQLTQNVLFQLQPPAFLLSPNPRTSSGLSRMLPCEGDRAFECDFTATGREVVWALCVQHGAPVIFFVVFIVPRDIFFLNSGTVSHP